MHKIVISVLLLGLAICAVADKAPIPFHVEPYTLQSAKFDGVAGRADFVAFSESVKMTDAPWLQLRFGECNLGEGSYILITAKEDGATQRLDAKSLANWYHNSACFNGEEIVVELHVASRDTNVSIDIKEVVVGERASARSICGSSDDRVSSIDPAIGRHFPTGCTGWIISSGSYLTAGHCTGSGLQMLQFNVPLSDPDGTTNQPHPDDQYPVKQSSVVFRHGGVGNDWAVFSCNPNSNTGLLPIEAQQASFRVSDQINPNGITITGYGVDDMPRGAKGGRNEFSQTQQTNGGSFLAKGSGTWLEYIVDTTGGNSGSPVIHTADKVTFGIHTHGGCSPPSSGNLGTSFENRDLMRAIENAAGPNPKFVDSNHPTDIERDGSMARPFRTISQAIAEVVENGTVCITSEVYQESLTIDKAMTISVPGGSATLVAKDYVSEGEVEPLLIEKQIVRSRKIFEAQEIAIEGLTLEKGADVTIIAKSVFLSSNIVVPEGAVLRIRVE